MADSSKLKIFDINGVYFVDIQDFVRYFANREDALKNLAKLKNKKFHITLQSAGGARKTLLSEEETKVFIDAVNNLRENGYDCTFNDGVSVEEALAASRKIDGWVKHINSLRIKGKELSPFEKLVCAYEICTDFFYNEEGADEDKSISRQIIKVLNGDKIVCVGFAEMLCQILSGCGIDCALLNIFEKERSVGHAICCLYLDDPKYGIKGKLVSDPTSGRRELAAAHAKLNFKHCLAMTLGFSQRLFEEYGVEDVMVTDCLNDQNYNMSTIMYKYLKKYADKYQKDVAAQAQTTQQCEQGIKESQDKKENAEEELSRKKALFELLQEKAKQLRPQIAATKTGFDADAKQFLAGMYLDDIDPNDLDGEQSQHAITKLFELCSDKELETLRDATLHDLQEEIDRAEESLQRNQQTKQKAEDLYDDDPIADDGTELFAYSISDLVYRRGVYEACVRILGNPSEEEIEAKCTDFSRVDWATPVDDKQLTEAIITIGMAERAQNKQITAAKVAARAVARLNGYDEEREDYAQQLYEAGVPYDEIDAQVKQREAEGGFKHKYLWHGMSSEEYKKRWETKEGNYLRTHDSADALEKLDQMQKETETE